MNNSRRNFFKTLAGLSGMALLAPSLLSSVARAEEKRRGGAAGGNADLALPLVEPGKGMAASVKYVKKSADPQKPCSKCMLYNKVGMKDGKEVGTCQLFMNPKELVMGEGTCGSWAEKKG